MAETMHGSADARVLNGRENPGLPFTRVFGNVSFDTPWAREDYIESKVLRCDVTFKGYYHHNVITAECMNVTVQIEAGHRGVMIGGPKSCGKSQHKEIMVTS
ncbi:type II/IV secretion system protein [Striga asiatica]|uniref:Type II/IV secretion system protein n=1 Tax=Striga asiatica TaxID=4170 RepID=A0A5A7P317_STRAF|nr:type II/IV secretion system protein [Striga asiatica]